MKAVEWQPFAGGTGEEAVARNVEHAPAGCGPIHVGSRPELRFAGDRRQHGRLRDPSEAASVILADRQSGEQRVGRGRAVALPTIVIEKDGAVAFNELERAYAVGIEIACVSQIKDRLI